MNKRLLSICIAIAASQSVAHAQSRHACEQRGSDLGNAAAFARDQKKTSGAETGAFVREAFKGSTVSKKTDQNRGLRSCVSIPRTNNLSQYDNTQSPVAYYAILPSKGSPLEMGIQFEESTRSFRAFRLSGGRYVNHPGDVDIVPGDRVCMEAWISESHGVFMNIFVNGRAVPGGPIGYAGKYGSSARFARITGFATRDPRTGKNGGFNLGRAKSMNSQGFSFEASWSEGELVSVAGKRTPIPPASRGYAYSSPSYCNLTTVWPSGVARTGGTGSTVVHQFFPSNMRR